MMDLKVVRYLNRGCGGKAATGRSVNKMQCIRVLRNHCAASYWLCAFVRLCVWCTGECTRVSPQSFSFCSAIKSFNKSLLQFEAHFLGWTTKLWSRFWKINSHLLVRWNVDKHACCFPATSSIYSHVFTFNSVEQLGSHQQGTVTGGIEQNESETFTLISDDVQMVPPAIFQSELHFCNRPNGMNTVFTLVVMCYSHALCSSCTDSSMFE